MSDTPTLPTVVTPRADVPPPPDGMVAKRRRRRVGLIQSLVGLCLLVPIVLAGVAAPALTSQDPGRVDMGARLTPPSWSEGGEPEHPLGTDHLGRDIWARVLFGARVSLMVGFAAVVASGLIGVAVGLPVGYYKGWLDTVVMGFADIQQSFPFLALAIVVVAVLGAGLGNLLIVLTLGGWILYARVVRAEVLSLSEKDFVEGARAAGASDLRIMLRHLLPNVRSNIIIISTFNFAWFIVAEASLSFLGLGVDPSTPSWGSMLADSRSYLSAAWWFPTFPGLALIACILGANLLGDGLRDLWDPRTR
jgi:peptide/nickel transport system permease protein